MFEAKIRLNLAFPEVISVDLMNLGTPNLEEF
jgi:hypothetical protein